MPSYDFEVDLKSLVSAAKKTAEVIQLKKDKDVEDYVPTESALGHAKLQESVNDFQDRWERAINSMTKDLEEISARLSKEAYSQTAWRPVKPLVRAHLRKAVNKPQGSL